MAEEMYCWRCGTDVMMVDEDEWRELQPLLQEYVSKVRDYRDDSPSALEHALKKGYDAAALNKYFEFTGRREHNIMSLWHHRISLYGPPCEDCGKPLRNPKARICASCGRYKEIPCKVAPLNSGAWNFEAESRVPGILRLNPGAVDIRDHGATELANRAANEFIGQVRA